MTADDTWAPLEAELGRWHDAGRTARLWLRDDDAIEPTVELDRLLDFTRDPGVPLTLAVIPATTGETLAARLATEPHALVALHGWSHTNHAGPEEKKQELGSHRPSETVLAELREGFSILTRLYPQQLVPMLVPPWNRISKALIPELPGLGLKALSVYGMADGESPIPLLNTHVDIMNWHGVRGGRPHAELVGELIAELRSRFEEDVEPIGILTHHLVHDATAWDFLTQLFAKTAGHPAVRWQTVRELMLT